ncbi:hypothetical protein [Herbaspirillum sp. RV1423]|uniref:hypothetical protein n=1 Tax=Herbaspirillum sp. RV1423 TaxID=1443993 RepID=UPI0018CC4D17|nr:hypothetical protein [Herbaspirillum sp. RV1423]
MERIALNPVFLRACKPYEDWGIEQSHPDAAPPHSVNNLKLISLCAHTRLAIAAPGVGFLTRLASPTHFQYGAFLLAWRLHYRTRRIEHRQLSIAICPALFDMGEQMKEARHRMNGLRFVPRRIARCAHGIRIYFS